MVGTQEIRVAQFLDRLFFLLTLFDLLRQIIHDMRDQTYKRFSPKISSYHKNLLSFD